MESNDFVLQGFTFNFQKTESVNFFERVAYNLTVCKNTCICMETLYSWTVYVILFFYFNLCSKHFQSWHGKLRIFFLQHSFKIIAVRKKVLRVSGVYYSHVIPTRWNMKAGDELIIYYNFNFLKRWQRQSSLYCCFPLKCTLCRTLPHLGMKIINIIITNFKSVRQQVV